MMRARGLAGRGHGRHHSDYIIKLNVAEFEATCNSILRANAILPPPVTLENSYLCVRMMRDRFSAIEL